MLGCRVRGVRVHNTVKSRLQGAAESSLMHQFLQSCWFPPLSVSAPPFTAPHMSLGGAIKK